MSQAVLPAASRGCSGRTKATTPTPLEQPTHNRIFISGSMNTSTSAPILECLSVLGDQMRTRILALLDGSEFTVSELCAVLQAPQPTISRHLKTLATEGWVEARAEGRNRHYHLSPQLDDAARSLWRIVQPRSGAHIPVSCRWRAGASGPGKTAYARDCLLRRVSSGMGPNQSRAIRFGDRAWPLSSRWSSPHGSSGTSGAEPERSQLVSRRSPRRSIGVDRSEAMLGTAKARLEDVENAEPALWRTGVATHSRR